MHNNNVQNKTRITSQIIGQSTPEANTTVRLSTILGRDRPNKNNTNTHSQDISLVSRTPHRHAVSPSIVSRVTSLQNKCKINSTAS